MTAGRGVAPAIDRRSSPTPALRTARPAVRRTRLAKGVGGAEDAAIDTLNPSRKDADMNSPRTPRFLAFALSLVMTFAIFSGVVSLSSPEHAGQFYAQKSAPQPA
jgi:hypothetical protein